ncbi:MAG: DUF2284 domain-containing protein [Desulfobacterales bacterium]|nr:DUF2284 domain-containing protein [Desulfobacterales bacterium]
MEKYIELAKKMNMVNAKLLSQEQMVFDIRALLKCHWGCENHDNKSYKCQKRDTNLNDRMAMVKKYDKILLVHGHDGHDVSRAVLKIERQAFLDGYHLAFGIRYCSLCKACAVDEGNECIQPLKVRPCEAIFGIDVYRTAALNDLPCYPLKDKDEPQNRYGFVCID